MHPLLLLRRNGAAAAVIGEAAAAATVTNGAIRAGRVAPAGVMNGHVRSSIRRLSRFVA